MTKLHELTVQWAKDRGILANGQITTQALKLGSEYGELCGNLAENKSIEDDIGDCLVVCTILSQLSGYDLLLDIFTIKPTIHTAPLVPIASKYLGDLQDNTIKGKDFSEDMRNFLHQIEGIGKTRHVTLKQCWEIAYNDIKDRKGILNEQGTFIKETDATYKETVERLKNDKAM